MDTRSLSLALRQGKMSAEEAVKAYLDRMKRYGGRNGLNAVSQVNEEALAQARRLDSRKDLRSSPLFGLPILVKDNIDVAGMITSAGSLALQDNRAERNAPIIDNLIRSGAVIMGKTNMTEFANFTTNGMPGGYSSAGGQVIHAYDPKVPASGSSTGSAVAVSADLCAMAVGTDTSFSVVACATVHGIVGLKPPVGRLSANGIVPIARTLDSAGALCHTMEEALHLYEGMLGKPILRPAPIPVQELRLCVNRHNREMVSDQQMRLYDELLCPLRNAGAQIAEIAQPHTPHQRHVMLCEFREDLEAYLRTSTAQYKTLDAIVERYEKNSETMMRYGIDTLKEALCHSRNDAEYAEALHARKQLRASICKELASCDACLMTGPTNIMHFIGLPSLSLPLGMGADGTPRGAILYGADESRLYGAALTIEQYCRPVQKPDLSRFS